MTAPNIEINIDGMIGPTHHFGGLGVGNIASLASQNQVSNPREAAMEGLAKMELVAGMGIPQFYLPPPERPNWRWLESLGFFGDRRDVLRRCFDEAPILLSAAYSSAFMWTANAATVAPSCDTTDSRLHVVPANLCSNLHRGQEATERRDQLRDMFCHLNDAQMHEPLPSLTALRDEGAANHMRLCSRDGQKAIHVFVYGPSNELHSTRFIARQSELAARRVAGLLQLRDEECVFVQQSARAINAGVFHNDVIAMSNGNMMIYHEHAFENSDHVVETIQHRFNAKTSEAFAGIRVSESELSLEEAVRTYLFNSQLLSVDSRAMEMISPSLCSESPAVVALIQQWLQDENNPIHRVRYLSLDQSMKNGGGPACLRLRALLTVNQLSLLGDRFRVTETRMARLRSEVIQRYPTTLSLSDLARLEFALQAIAAAKVLAALI